MNAKKITDFWNWIENNIDHLVPKLITKEYSDLLDEQIGNFGDFGWEIGFDNRISKNFLTISPEGNRELLEKSKAIINQSPIIEDWIFYSTKPPKQWNLLFNLLIDNRKVEFNANEWEYVLYKYPDNLYDVVIKVPESYRQYEEYFNDLGYIAVSGELGEAFVIEYFSEIELVFSFNEKEKGREKNLNHIKTEILM